MSRVLILFSDIEMPELQGAEGVSVTESYYGLECPEIRRFAEKAYFYELDISASEPALWKLKKYLAENTEPGGEVQLWSIWLGGDFTKHYASMPKTSNIPKTALKDTEDSIDMYAEEHFHPEVRTTGICQLSIDDILFIDNHTGACLIVRR